MGPWGAGGKHLRVKSASFYSPTDYKKPLQGCEKEIDPMDRHGVGHLLCRGKTGPTSTTDDGKGATSST